ncbi:MAG: VWA domain-containing protein [Pseudomonadota bacterium]
MTDVWTNLLWREPLWLWLAAVPLLLAGWRARRRARVLRYADADLLPWAANLSTAKRDAWPRALAHALAWALLALAAAGPRLPLDWREGQTAPRHVVTVMVALDVSASMHASDIVPDRQTRARLELLDWLPKLQGERVGLIIYAGEAGVLLPPTDDLDLLRRALDQVDSHLIEAPGTNLAAALDLARAQLAAAPGHAKAVLLVSDAESDSVEPAAQASVEALRKAHLPLFVLGVGSEAGAPVPLPDGGFAERDGVRVLSRMDAATYGQWARSTGGRFVEAVDGDGDWAALNDGGIAALPGDPVAAGSVRAWRELYAWCLVPALALFMAVYLPRRAVATAAVAVLFATFAPSPAQADEAAAWQAWQAKRYASAQTLYAQLGGYAGQMGAGAAAWRQADYAAAVRHFGAALLLAANDRERADALYNLGNAHYTRGQWLAAVEAYQTVLRMRPADTRARANLETAWHKLQRQLHDAPMPSDLRSRHGFLAEGRIQTDNADGRMPDEPEIVAPGMQVERGHAPGESARAAAPAGSQAGIGVDSRLAPSGLKKLARLQDHPQTMLRNLLKQDASSQPGERPAW